MNRLKLLLNHELVVDVEIVHLNIVISIKSEVTCTAHDYAQPVTEGGGPGGGPGGGGSLAPWNLDYNRCSIYVLSRVSSERKAIHFFLKTRVRTSRSVFWLLVFFVFNSYIISCTPQFLVFTFLYF